MSGFTGYLIHEKDNHEKIIRAMSEKIHHRGPDDEGYFIDEKIAIGVRRLAVIDLDKVKQPIVNEDGSKILAFNGNIYNYCELRDDLEKRGHQFRTETDCEVMLHGYEEYGMAFLERIRGPFAFVIWDKNLNKLVGARDIFGVKPFYYYDDGRSFLFGSEIKSFLPHPRFEKEFNEEHLAEYLSFEYLPSQETLFKNVCKLLPGHYFEYQNGEIKCHPYDRLQFEIDDSKSLEEYVDLIEKALEESVRVHGTGDVEIGGFLSSGIDSSYVACEASKHRPLKTFSVGYEEEPYSELAYSTEFANHLGIDNYALKISADDFFGAAPDVQYYMDEPLSNPSAVPLYFLAKHASRHVKVVFSGEGADELFGGYNQYKEALVYEKYQKLPSGFRRLLASAAKNMPRIKGRRFLIRGAMPLKERYFRIDYVFNYEQRQRLLKNKHLNRECAPLTERLFDEVAHLNQQTQMQYFDFHTWQVFDILLKADRMSMAHSLEIRMPFLDKELLKIAVKLPSHYKVTKENTKIALRKAALRKLPSKTANKKKLGFPSPLASWMKQEKYYRMIKEKFTSETAERFFETDELLRLLDAHRKGTEANMQKIWSIYCFILWYEQYFGCSSNNRESGRAINGAAAVVK